MAVVGVIATAIVGAVAAAGVFVGVRSIADVKRYFKIRGM